MAKSDKQKAVTKYSSNGARSLHGDSAHVVRSILSPVLFILLGALLRLIPHPPNVAPVAAMALFGGVYLDKKYALLLPLLAMVVSDLFLGLHNTMLFVYGSFALTGCIGIWLKGHKSLANIVIASLISSLLFFLITNFGVWLMGSMYPKTHTGLTDAYLMGIPFFRSTLIGDLFYTTVFFGSYEFLLTFFWKNHFAYGRKT